MRTLAREIDGLELPAVEKISESQQKDPFQILISALLSARTQDATTLAASTRLFAKAPTAEALAKMRVTRPMMAMGMGPKFNFGVPAGGAMGAVMAGPGPIAEVREFRHFWPGEFVGMKLASITPKLGAYFGTSEGVLVVQAPQDAAFKLEDGDVIQAIDGRKPEDGAHAMRILRSYKAGEKLNLSVLRQRKPLTLAITMPERPEFDGNLLAPMPPEPPRPPMPAVPATPASPPSGA